MSTDEVRPLDRDPRDLDAVERDDVFVEALRRGEHPSDPLVADLLAAWRDEAREQRRSMSTIAGLVAVVLVVAVLALFVTVAIFVVVS